MNSAREKDAALDGSGPVAQEDEPGEERAASTQARANVAAEEPSSQASSSGSGFSFDGDEFHGHKQIDGQLEAMNSAREKDAALDGSGPVAQEDEPGEERAASTQARATVAAEEPSSQASSSGSAFSFDG